jgi:hypothetical protein
VASPSRYQVLTIAGALAVGNSVLIGGTLGLAMKAGTGALAAPTPWDDHRRDALAGQLARAASDLARGAAASVSTTSRWQRPSPVGAAPLPIAMAGPSIRDPASQIPGAEWPILSEAWTAEHNRDSAPNGGDARLI